MDTPQPSQPRTASTSDGLPLAAHRFREVSLSRGREWNCSCGVHLGAARGGVTRQSAQARHAEHRRAVTDR